MLSEDPPAAECGNAPDRDPPKKMTATAAGLGGLALIVAVVLWDANALWSWDAFLKWKSQIDYLPFFLGVALLPLLGFPSTPLFVLAGVTFPPLAAIGGVAASIALNLCLSHWLANRWMRAPVERGMKRWRISWPEHDSHQALRALVVLRLTPGLPAFLKNYVTALLDVPFRLFLVISWFITFVYALGLIVMGDSLVNQNPVEAVIGAAILAVSYFLIRLVQRRLAGSGHNAN